MKSTYAYSIKTSRVREKDFPYNDQTLKDPKSVFAFTKSLQDSDIEKMIVLYLDAANKLICIQLFPGTVNQAVIYPREVIRHGLLCGACCIILAHNHPSGNLKPSDSDITITRRIKEAAEVMDILFHDHLIISENSFYSFREEGFI